MAVEPASVPDFDHLPPVPGMPRGCAWGLFDRDGRKDVLGTLNFVTPHVVRAAAAEVTDGVSISLNWPLNALTRFRLPDRSPPRHTVLYLPDSMPGLVSPDTPGWDDELSFNTQASSQWDGLCHVHHWPSRLAYNGARPDAAALSAPETSADNPLPTLDHWHPRGGLVARGVLLDYAAFAAAARRPFGPVDGSVIRVANLDACAAHFAVVFRPGDVLLLRTGTTDALGAAPADGNGNGPAAPPPEQAAAVRLSGLEGSEDMARWLWNHRFAAVASDSFALEAYPTVKPDGTVGGFESLVLHHYMLGLFGMPIGELWDLGRLAEHCHQTKRCSFMLTSVPLNHPCLIASPPNALAIF